MRRVLAASAIAAAVLSTGSAAAESPLLALTFKRPGPMLVRVDAGTLRELPGPRVPLGRAAGAWSFSPDGSRLAIGSYKALGLRIVDARTLRVVRDIHTRNGAIAFAAWLSPRRILGWEMSGAFAVDPVAGKLLRYQSSEGHLIDAEASRDALVVLLGAPDGRSCRLGVVGLDGRLRVVGLERMRCTMPVVIDPDAELEIRRPGLAVDPDRGKAYVVGSGDPILEVDLRTLDVTQLVLQTRVPAKFAVPTFARSAEWLGGGMLAVTGVDTFETYVGANGILRGVETPVGLRLIDVTAGVERRLDPTTTEMRVSGSTLLGFGTWEQRGGEFAGDGLRAYRRDGSLVFHAFAGERIWHLTPVGGVLYAARGAESVVVDAFGAVVRRVDRLPELIAGTRMRPAV